MTRGEQVIRPDFSKSSYVKDIKQTYADLYDKINAIAIPIDPTVTVDPEIKRLVTISLENLEISAMFAVKAMTA